MKELEKVMIEDVEYSYDPEKEYIKDGHAYCKVCHERKDGKVMEFFDNKMIFKISCKCDRNREAKEKERQKQMEIERLKSSCFNSIIQWSYTFENYQGEENQSLIIAKNFKELKKELNRYGVKFSVMKDKESGKYSVFFQAKDMKVMEKAFKHALSESEKKTERKESIHKNIEKFKEMAKNSVSKDKIKNKQKEQSL